MRKLPTVDKLKKMNESSITASDFPAWCLIYGYLGNPQRFFHVSGDGNDGKREATEIKEKGDIMIYVKDLAQAQAQALSSQHGFTL